MSFNRDYSKGLTLIELLIAMALSLIAVVFLVNILSASSRMNAQTEAIGQAQENGRFALSWLQSNVRKAGYVGANRIALAPFAERCDDREVKKDSRCSLETEQGSQNIAVQHRYSGEGDAKLSCSGVALDAQEGEVLTDVYWLDIEELGDGYNDSLLCKTYVGERATSQQKIANGIEGMNVLYGYSDSNDGVITRYASLQEIGGHFSWEHVHAIRIAVLTRSFGRKGIEKRIREYVLFNTSVTKEDEIARSIQTVTVFLPNQQKL